MVFAIAAATSLALLYDAIRLLRINNILIVCELNIRRQVVRLIVLVLGHLNAVQFFS
jgi:hypothetical protein